MSTGLRAERATTWAKRERVRWAEALRSPAVPWIALATLVLGTGALLYHETRGTTILFDEWTWVLHRRGDSLSTFLASHDGHLSLIPIALYRLLFATVGLRHYGPYRAVMIVEHLAICALVFVYARRRVGPILALVASAVMLIFGPGWENLLWAFQVTWNTSLLAGLAALLALDRRDRAGDIAVCLLLVISLASSGVGVPILLGIGLEVVLVRRRHPREWWVVAVPALLYAAWAIDYQHTIITRHAFVAAPSFVATGVASTFGGLAGLGGSTGVDGPGSLMTFGPVLLLAALALAAWRLTRLRRVEPRVAALATIVLSFWVITALNRSVFADPYSSRYLYVSALFVVLLAVELARGAVITWRIQALIAAVAAAAIASNFGALRDAARNLRSYGQATTAEMGALDIARPVVPRGYYVQGIPGWPVVLVPAAAYFAAARAVPMPADTPAQIAVAPESVRLTVDTELIHVHRIGLLAARPGGRAGSPPAVEGVSGGSVVAGSGCVRFVPSRFIPAGTPSALAVVVPQRGLLLRVYGLPATVGVRRFADQFQTVGTLAPGGPAELQISPDRSSRRWHVQLSTAGPAAACGLP
jgi:hypothetical protein